MPFCDEYDSLRIKYNDRTGFLALRDDKVEGDKAFPVWSQPDGEPVSCLEKIKVLNQNYGELRAIAQDALEDAMLMGCDEQQFRNLLHDLINGLENPYPKR